MKYLQYSKSEIQTFLKAGSYTVSDIPKFFRVVFYLKDGAKGLKKGVLEGVKGISDSKEIVMQWLSVNRDAVLIMPPKETIRLNNLSRVMYNNPHYLLQDNMAALLRIWSQRDRQGVIQNLFEYVLAYWRTNKKYSDAHYAGQYFGFYQALSYIYKDSINGSKDLAKWVVKKGLPELEKDRPELSHYIGLLKKLTIRDWEESIIEGLKTVAKVYGNEGEWILKNGILKVPPKSKLLVVKSPMYIDWMKFMEDRASGKIKIPEGIDEKEEREWYTEQHSPQVAMVKKYNLDKKYKVIYLNKKRFENIKKKFFDRRYIK
jgi:hypothetical protein